jgi:hypothetical protein
MKSGDKTIEKCEIICPFCLSNTKRWKMFHAVWKWNLEKTELFPEEIDKLSARKFENKVLSEHLPNCSFKDILSDSVRKHYELN